MRVHGDHSGEIFDLDLPKGLGHSQFIQQKNILDPHNTFRQHCGGATSGVQIYGPMLLEGIQGHFAHTAFAHNASNTKIPDDSGFVGFFANAGGGSGTNFH